MPPEATGAGETAITAVLADDAVIVREGLARILTDAGIHVVAQSADADGLLASVTEHRPTIAIVDIRMPPTFTREGLDAARNIRADFPSVAVLLLSSHVEVQDAVDLLAAPSGGIGYLLKESATNVEEFVASVKSVARGGSVVDRTLVGQLLGRRRRAGPLSDLTPREREVLELMARGKSNAGIAHELVVTEGAVEKYVKNILSKMEIGPDAGVHRRVRAVLAFLDGR